MRNLEVIRSGLFYNGRIYQKGETFDVEEDVHALVLTAGGDAKNSATLEQPTYTTADMNAPKRKYIRRDLTAG